MAGGAVEITEIRLTMRNEDKLKAFANVTFDNAFVIRGMKIISGNKGLFISMPSKKRSDGTYQDIAHPVNTDMRRLIERAVLDAYDREINKMGMSKNIKKNR
jgi:stage V sporulation protein G